MIHRSALNLVRSRLEQSESVALLGPRQVGKTTLALEIVGHKGDNARYLDLMIPEDKEQLVNPGEYFTEHAHRLIVLDEIQCFPDLFMTLRGQIDARNRPGGGGGKFLFLGSASMELQQQSSESLAGRISYIEFGPLTLSEVLLNYETPTGDESIITSQLPHPEAPELISSVSAKNQDNIPTIRASLWLRGGFPKSYLAQNDEASIQWRHDFIRTYLEQDVKQYGFQVGPTKLKKFWELLACNQGGEFIADRFCKDLRADKKEIESYLSILDKLLLVRQLQPWSNSTRKRLIKSPKVYIRDTGILHALLRLQSIDDLINHSIKGHSWEGFVIEALITSVEDKVQPYFYRVQSGAEVDLVLELAPGRCWAIEIKFNGQKSLGKGFHSAADDIEVERRILIYNGDERYKMPKDVEAMPLQTAITEVQNAVKGHRQ